jgi:predicted transposase/invertase (TIGR01784 family)
LDDGTYIQVEMQLADEKYLEHRGIFGIGRMVADQVLAGDDYGRLCRSVSVVITGFEWMESDCYANRFRLYDADSGCSFSDLLGVYVLELPKVQKSADSKATALYHWMQLLLADSAEELAKIDYDDPRLRRAVDMLLQLNEEDAVREEAFRADNARRKAEGERLAAIDKGVAKGRAEEKLETATKAFAQGLSIETVQAITGLNLDTLEGLQV